jgi:hypothetical protein
MGAGKRTWCTCYRSRPYNLFVICMEQEGILEHYWGEHIHLGHYE